MCVYVSVGVCACVCCFVDADGCIPLNMLVDICLFVCLSYITVCHCAGKCVYLCVYMLRQSPDITICHSACKCVYFVCLYVEPVT